MDLETRIAQFEELVREDPSNDVAHFSLGSAYAQAGRPREAATSFERCIAVNPQMSKAYQLAAEQYLAMDDEAKALPLMEKGYSVATMQGDMMPKRAIAALYEGLGQAPPDVIDPASDDIPEGTFVCKRTGRPGTEMERPPFKGAIGVWISQNITVETWNDWIKQGTMVINELRLDLSRDEDAEKYDEHMYNFLGLTPDKVEELQAS